MEDFFCTMYSWTNGMYSYELDNYLYETVPGYLHTGLVMIISSIVTCAIYYYVYKPVRRQLLWWFLFFFFDAVINFIFSLYYTLTPLVNNAIDSNNEWTNLDCIFYGFSDIIWAFLAYLFFSLVIKKWSPCKYIPFQIF